MTDNIRIYLRSALFFLIICLFFQGELLGQQWQEVKSKEDLASLYSNTQVILDGQRGEYCADGSGIIFAHGTSFPRTWKVQDQSVCISSETDNVCYSFEQNTQNSSEFRVLNLQTGDRVTLTIMPGGCGSDITSGLLFEDWEAIRTESAIREVFNNKVYEWDQGRAEFCSDGTGTVYAYSNEFTRTWEVKDQGYCITSLNKTVCYTIEQHASDPELLREKNLTTGEYALIRLSAKTPGSCKD